MPGDAASETRPTLEPDVEAARTACVMETEGTPASLAHHTQAVLQGAFIQTKANGDAQVARDSVDHLARYLTLPFQSGGPDGQGR